MPKQFSRKPPFGTGPNLSHPRAQGLIGAWELNEGGGLKAYDSTGRYGAGDLTNGPTWERNAQGVGLSLAAASSNFVNIPHNPTLSLTTGGFTSFTFEVMFRLNSLRNYNGLITKQIGNGTNPLDVYVDASGNLNIGVGTAFITNSAVMAANVWYVLSIVFQDGTPGTSSPVATAYLNGVKIGSNTYGVDHAAPDSTNSIKIGGRADGATYGDERIAFARLWNRAISAAEAQDGYVNPWGMYAVRKIRPLTTVSIPAQNVTIAAGIVSAEAFGSTGLSVQNTLDIAISAGIPSAEAFGAGLTVNLGANQGITIASGIPSAEVFGVSPAVGISGSIVIATGIPSAEAFGVSPTVTPNLGIVIPYGIPSAEAFGPTAVLLTTVRSFTLFIAGVDKTLICQANTLNVSNPLSQSATATFSVYDPAGTYRPSVGQTVLMYHGTVLVFGGTIEEWTEAAYPGQSGNLILVKCTDFSNLLDRHIIGEYYPANPSDPDAPRLGLMVADIANKYLATDGILYDGSDGSPGLVMGAQLFAWQTIRQVFNTLANLTGWDFSVDYNKVLRFFPHLTGRGTAPFNIADGDKNVLSDEASATSGSTSLSIRTYRGTYRNRQYVRSSSAVSPLWHDIFSSTNQGPYPNSPQPPDGTRFFFVTLYGIISTPTVTVNGVTQRVISFLDLATTPSANWDWYWIPQQGAPNPAPGVGQNMNNARLTASDTLIVGYPTNIPSIYSVDCTAQIVDRAAIEGNSGIYADIQDAGNITDPSAIAQYALGLLNRYGCTNGMPTQVLYSTDSAGLFAGMLQTIQRSKPLIASGVYQISSVSFRDIDGKFLRYQVTADSGQFQGDWTQFFGQIQTAIQLPQPANRMVYNWLLAPSYPGITNPGLGAGGTQPQLQVIQNPFESFQYFTIAFPTPTTADLDVNILQNGTTTGYYTVPAGTQGSKTFYYAQALSYPAGTTMQVFVNTHGGTIKDAIVTLVTSVVVSA